MIGHHNFQPSLVTNLQIKLLEKKNLSNETDFELDFFKKCFDLIGLVKIITLELIKCKLIFSKVNKTTKNSFSVVTYSLKPYLKCSSYSR